MLSRDTEFNAEGRRLVTLMRRMGVRYVLDFFSGERILDYLYDPGKYDGIDLYNWIVMREPAGINMVRQPYTSEELSGRDRSMFTSKGSMGSGSRPARVPDPERYTDMVTIINADPSRTDYYQGLADQYSREIGRGDKIPLIICERFS